MSSYVTDIYNVNYILSHRSKPIKRHFSNIFKIYWVICHIDVILSERIPDLTSHGIIIVSV